MEFLDVSSMFGPFGQSLALQETLKPEEVKRFLCNAKLKSKEDLLQRGEGWVPGHFFKVHFNHFNLSIVIESSGVIAFFHVMLEFT